MTDTPHTVNAYGVDPNTIDAAHADRVARALGLAHAVRIGCGGFLFGISRGVLTITPEPFDLRNPRIVSVPWALVAGLGNPPAVELIAAERRRQVEAEGWAPEHDDQYEGDALARAAACYALAEDMRSGNPRFFWGDDDDAPYGWPWAAQWWKPTPSDRVRELVKAGALIVAEIERLQRKARP